MKFSFVAHLLLIDCGKASKQTQGLPNLPLSEAGTAPTNRFNQ
jgi:hypothetical protein